MLKPICVALLSVSLLVSGCTTTRTLSPEAGSSFIRTQLHPGEKTRILLKSGQVRRLTLRAVDEQTITGVEGTGKSATVVQIALADVQSVEYRHGSGFKTAGLVVGIVVGAAAVVVGAYLVTCGKSGGKCSE